MLIVSQDKDLIINFENVTVIGIATSNSKEIDSITTDRNEQYLGTYKTEERAKEILEEIVNKYKATEMLKVSINRLSDEVGAIGMKESFVYEMPKE